MADKTIALSGAEIRVEYGGGANAWLRNDGASRVYAAKSAGISAGADGVVSIPAGGSAPVYGANGAVYLLGAGSVQLIGSDYSTNPFNGVSRGGAADIPTGAAGMVELDGLQGGVPFSEIVLDGDIVGQEVTLRACGKNLMPSPNWSNAKITSNGVTFSAAENGTITISGTTTGNATVHLMTSAIRVTEPVTLRANGTLSGISLIVNLTKDGSTVYRTVYGKAVIEAGVTINDIYLQQQKTGVDVSGEISPQLERGSTATAYEPYRGSEVKITPDVTPYIVPNDIRQQDGVNNIMVSAGTVQVTGARRNAALKKVWDKLDELTTAIIVSNGD